MQKEVPSPKQKSKSTQDGMSKFERAQRLFQDIENIIEHELANTPIIAANYESNFARVKRSKRKRPGLIRNFNNKKNRLVIGGMEFDPDTMTWLGNEEALSAFSPQQPALITNIGKHDKAKVVGKMVWDPKDLKWKGNEKDALKFAPRKPALITPLGGNSYLQKEVSGMVFDPVTMRWIGNDAAVDIFSSIDSLDDSGFTVGNEFHLSAALTKSFGECANRHKATLAGWFADGNLDKKNHLYAIRNMSILRVVRDVKQRRATYVDLDDDLVPERDVPSPSPRDINSGNDNNTDTENYDDLQFNGSARLKLPEVGVGTDDWDKEFEDDIITPPLSAKDDSSNKPSLNGTQPLTNNNNNNANTSTTNNNNNKKAEEEDWDNDFAAAEPEVFSRLKAVFVNKKPFQETNNRGSIIDLRERRNTVPIKPKPIVEEDDDGFDLPPGPIQLVPKPKSTTTGGSSGESGFDDESSSSTSNKPDHGKTTDTEDDFEEEEEDWTDVDIPATLPSQPVLKPHQDREDWDNDADIEIISNKLTLKPRVRVSDDDDDDENLLAGVEIPDDFAARLRK